LIYYKKYKQISSRLTQALIAADGPLIIKDWLLEEMILLLEFIKF